MRALLLAVLVTNITAAQTQDVDRWAPVRPLVGRWKGAAEGRSGNGQVERTYEFVMNGRFLQERNTSTYPPQEKNPKGETHEHMTMFSYDRARKTIVMRQFHVEGFINQYARITSDKLVFESEAFENLPAGWRARESYEFPAPDEFVETFELAAPGKDFEVYSRTHFKRVK